jgi:hypothetical protein
LKNLTKQPQITPQIATIAISPTEPPQTTPEEAPATTKTTTAKWQPTRTARAAPKPDADRSCWLYLHNDIGRDISTRRYKGDKEQWK